MTLAEICVARQNSARYTTPKRKATSRRSVQRAGAWVTESPRERVGRPDPSEGVAEQPERIELETLKLHADELIVHAPFEDQAIISGEAAKIAEIIVYFTNASHSISTG